MGYLATHALSRSFTYTIKEITMSKLTHFNQSGEAHMVDVGHKTSTHRIAIATGQIRMNPQTLEKILQGSHKKGDVLGIARVAGIMAAKQTSNLIPLCHPLPLTRVEIDLQPWRFEVLDKEIARKLPRMGLITTVQMDWTRLIGCFLNR